MESNLLYRNRNAVTIEGVLLDALKRCGVIGGDITIENLQQVKQKCVDENE